MPIVSAACFFVFGILFPAAPVKAALSDFTLSGGPSPTDNFCVDDDIYVYLNGDLIYRDIDPRRASCNNRPISFQAEIGAALRVVAIDSVGICRGLGPIWLHQGSQSLRLDIGKQDGCKNWPPGVTFYDKIFIIPQAAPEPIIIVPGIMGSYLYSYIDPGVEVWPAIVKTVIDPWDLHLNQLIMDEQGQPLPGTMIVPPEDIIRSILNNDFFEGLINELKQNGYEENENLFVFPYDWRLDLNLTADHIPYSGFESLKEKIERVKLETGAEKVNIIAHSLGGLVSKLYLKQFGGGSVNKFIDIGTPHLGALGAFKTLMYGDDLDFNYFGIGINSERVKVITQNLPSVYQSLPGRNYFDSTNQDYAYYIYDMSDLDGNGITGRLDYDQSIDFMKNTGRNDYLLGLNDVFHSELDDYSPKLDGVKTYNLMGCGRPVIGQIFVLNKEKSGGYEYGLKYISGDGTVPLRSAEALEADESFYAQKVEHSSLPSSDGLKQIVVAILNDTINSFPLNNYPLIARNSAGCSLNGTQISFHSPIELNIYDENNNHLGPNENGDIELGITGAQYDDLDGNKFAFLPQGHDYTVVGKATDAGAFNARVQIVQNGQYTQTVYYNQVPLDGSGAEVKLQINNGQPAGAIEIDQDGDQIFETLVEPSAVLNQEEAEDLISPETQIEISGAVGNNSYYISTTTESLIASDNLGGSGILKTQYSLDNGLTWENYQSPIILDSDGEYNILYKTTDRAGNVENVKEQKIKIDKTPPLINIFIPIAEQEFLRSGNLTPEYEIKDGFSGIASDSLVILIDGQAVFQDPFDLFNYALGIHGLSIKIEDMAGNQAIASINFMIIANLDSTLSDINRSYAQGWIKDEAVRDWLAGKLYEIKEYEQGLGEKQVNLEEKELKIIEECERKKNEDWCQKKLDNYYNRVVYRLEQMDEVIVKKYQEILKQLEAYYLGQWLNQSAYDIIKADINYLISNI